jgi:hypothetical protein
MKFPRKLLSAHPIYSTWKITAALAFGAVFLPMVISAQDAPCVPSQDDQVTAVGSLRTINTAEAYYAKEYGKGFSSTLAALGVPPEGTKVSPEAAGLLANSLTSGRKVNFIFKYKAGAQDAVGKISTYAVTAQPVKWREGVNSFFTDQTAVIRWTDQNRSPRASDPAL